jgi:sugar phosphate isomerase/epimerase
VYQSDVQPVPSSVFALGLLHQVDQIDRFRQDLLALRCFAFLKDVLHVACNQYSWSVFYQREGKDFNAALDKLGGKLRQMGLTLAYHNHDIELRNAAREFHHMMVGTNPENVTLCLDAHWIYRGAGNSQVALFDVLKLYGPRVTELHLRQSQNGVWTEVFGPGDIDYPRLADHLREIGIRPLLVLEQAIEAGSPHTTQPVEAFKESTEYTRKIFVGFDG